MANSSWNKRFFSVSWSSNMALCVSKREHSSPKGWHGSAKNDPGLLQRPGTIEVTQVIKRYASNFATNLILDAKCQQVKVFPWPSSCIQALHHQLECKELEPRVWTKARRRWTLEPLEERSPEGQIMPFCLAMPCMSLGLAAARRAVFSFVFPTLGEQLLVGHFLLRYYGISLHKAGSMNTRELTAAEPNWRAAKGVLTSHWIIWIKTCVSLKCV